MAEKVTAGPAGTGSSGSTVESGSRERETADGTPAPQYTVTVVEYRDTEVHGAEAAIDEASEALEEETDRLNAGKPKNRDRREPVDNPLAGWRRDDRRLYLAPERRGDVIRCMREVPGRTGNTPGAAARTFIGRLADLIEQLHGSHLKNHIILELN